MLRVYRYTRTAFSVRELPEFPAKFAGLVAARSMHFLTAARNYSMSYQVRATCVLTKRMNYRIMHRLPPASNKS